MPGNREISNTPSAVCEGRSVKAISRTTDMHVLEKPDCALFLGLCSTCLFLRPRSPCHHAIPGRLKLLWIADTGEKHETHVSRKGSVCKTAIVFRQWWPARSSRQRNRGRELKGIHAAACQGLVRILQQPGAVVTFLNQVGGDNCPLATILRRSLLAIPKLRFRNVDGWIGKRIWIDPDVCQTALPHEILDFEKALVPIEIGIGHQEVAWTTAAQ